MENLDILILTGIVSFLFAAFAFTFLKATNSQEEEG